METEVLIPTLFYLSSAQMDTIRPFFPRSRGIPRVDDQRILSGSIYVLKFGLQWKDAPKEYGPYTTLYNRSVGNKEKIFEELRRQYVDILITDTVSLLMPVATHGDQDLIRTLWHPALMLEHDESAQRFELLAGTREKRAPGHFEQSIHPDTESTPDPRAQVAETQREMGKDASFSPDANKVQKAVEEGRSMSRQGIEHVTGLSKSKTIQCLSRLVSEKRVAKYGQGKGSYYTPITR